MALSVDGAIDLINNVFPDVERRFIAQMLQENKYHVERTIEAILRRIEQSPPPPVQTRSIIPPTSPPPSTETLDAKSYLIRKPTLGSNNELIDMCKGRRGKPVELSNDFLRVPAMPNRQNNRDEEFAKLLQDQEFRNSLQAEFGGQANQQTRHQQQPPRQQQAQVQYLPRNEIPAGYVLYQIDSVDGLDPPRVMAFPPNVKPDAMHAEANITRLGVIGVDIFADKNGFRRGVDPNRTNSQVPSNSNSNSNAAVNDDVNADSGMFGSFKNRFGDFMSQFRSEPQKTTATTSQPVRSGEEMTDRPLLSGQGSDDGGGSISSDSNGIRLQTMVSSSTETASGARKYTFQDDDDNDNEPARRASPGTTTTSNDRQNFAL